MTTTTRAKSFVFIVILGLFYIAATPFAAKAQTAEEPDLARLSSMVDDAFVLGKDDVEWSFAEPNLPIEQGDLIQTNETGMAEVQFHNGVILRLGENSRVAFVEMGDQKVVGMDSGRALLRNARVLEGDEVFVLTFPNGQISIIGEALARINALEDGTAEISVIRGTAQLQTNSEAGETVVAGERALVNSEGWVDLTAADPAKRDDFDAWSEERDIALSTYRRPSHIEEDVIGDEDLEDYGEWVYVETYDSYAWDPYVVEEWRPYSNGRWYYSTLHGWSWIPAEPWGYVTHHYGSWNYDPYYGWVWIAGYEWRPSHVHWIVSDDYVGWVPLGYYGYPVVSTYPYYRTHISIGFFDFISFTFSDRHHFHGHHGHHGHHGRHRHKDRHDRHAWHYGDRHDRGRHDRDRHDRDGHDGDRHDRDRHGDGKWDYGKKGPGRSYGDNPAIDRDKLRKANWRSAGKLDDKIVKRNQYKGNPARQQYGLDSIVDVKKNPKLQQKIAKLNQRRAYSGKTKTLANYGAPPKKRYADHANALDFRRKVRERKAASLGSSDIQKQKAAKRIRAARQSQSKIAPAQKKSFGDRGAPKKEFAKRARAFQESRSKIAPLKEKSVNRKQAPVQSKRAQIQRQWSEFKKSRVEAKAPSRKVSTDRKGTTVMQSDIAKRRQAARIVRERKMTSTSQPSRVAEQRNTFGRTNPTGKANTSRTSRQQQVRPKQAVTQSRQSSVSRSRAMAPRRIAPAAPARSAVQPRMNRPSQARAFNRPARTAPAPSMRQSAPASSFRGQRAVAQGRISKANAARAFSRARANRR